MPELPEVETIKNELYNNVVGRRITSITIDDPRPVQNPLEEFTKGVSGQKIKELQRRGKYLVFSLSNGKFLIIHLRMTGAVLFDPGKVGKYARVIFGLDDDHEMVFTDRRRLGVIRLTGSLADLEKKLGPEPLTVTFSAAVLAQRLKGRHAPIKAVLLDQKVLAGVGNMYADEALFAAKIHPIREAGDLNKREIGRLHGAIVSVLTEAVANKGASVDTYQRPDGAKGTAHENFKVAHQRGAKCPNCGGNVERIVVRGRGTYLCPKCQKI
jgi:formamidopyrimidine-DNA glycosylase